MVQQNPDTRSFPTAPNRRAALAFIALADAAVPEDVRFDVHSDPSIGQCLYLILETRSDFLAWADLLGIPPERRDRHQSGTSGNWINSAHDVISGWHVGLTAYEPVEPAKTDLLDDATRQQLRQQIDGPS